MKPNAEMTREELKSLKAQLKAEYKEYQGNGLNLNMARGKPCTEQLDLSMGMMDVLSSEVDLTCEDGTDCRNYGCRFVEQPAFLDSGNKVGAGEKFLVIQALIYQPCLIGRNVAESAIIIVP